MSDVITLYDLIGAPTFRRWKPNRYTRFTRLSFPFFAERSLGTRLKQYADDTTMSLVSSDARQLEEGLVDDLEGVARWVEAIKLQLNVKKIKLMLLQTCSFHVSQSSNSRTL